MKPIKVIVTSRDFGDLIELLNIVTNCAQSTPWAVGTEHLLHSAELFHREAATHVSD